MSTTLPVTFRAAPLPSNFVGTPQAFADALVSRLSVQSDTSFSIFTIGGTAPSSNTGPWLKDGVTWYVYDPSVGTYVPEILESRSLRYVASVTAPSNALYTFWIELDVSGKAQSIKYYHSGAWKDVYEDKFLQYPTTAQMNSAIAAAVGGIDINQFPFRAYKSSSPQSYTGGTGDGLISFDVKNFDPSSVFNTGTGRFTAPATGYYYLKAGIYVSETGGGGPTSIDRQIKLLVNGNEVTNFQSPIDDNTTGRQLAVSDERLMVAGDYAEVAFWADATGASTWSILNNTTTTFFTGHRIRT